MLKEKHLYSLNSEPNFSLKMYRRNLFKISHRYIAIICRHINQFFKRQIICTKNNHRICGKFWKSKKKFFWNLDYFCIVLNIKKDPGGSMSWVVGLPSTSYKPITNSAALDSQPQVIMFTSCLSTVGGSLRVLRLLPPLKLVAMI